VATNISIDDEVMNGLKKKAVDLGLVFSTPNEVLRVMLGIKKQDSIIVKKYEDIEITSPSTSLRWHVMPVRKRIRRFFPGYKLPFILETDMGEVKTYVSSAPQGTHIGDPDKGAYIQRGLKNWFDSHQSKITNGTILQIQAVEPGKRYRLLIKE